MKKFILINTICALALVLLSANLKQEIVSRIQTNINAPILLQPAPNQYIPDTTCTLVWNTTHPKHVYEVFISTDCEFASRERFASFDTTIVYNLSKQMNKTIYWKVRAYKNKKTFSRWSEVSYFHCGLQPADNLIAPPPGGCRGNCGSCTHPCGRRKQYEYIKPLN